MLSLRLQDVSERLEIVRISRLFDEQGLNHRQGLIALTRLVSDDCEVERDAII
jgi:hypothetical protein